MIKKYANTYHDYCKDRFSLYPIMASLASSDWPQEKMFMSWPMVSKQD